MNFTFLALWILFSIVEGMREAYYYSVKLKAILGTQKTSSMSNEHVMFTVQRAIALGIVGIGMRDLGLTQSLLVVLSCVCSFPFFHDGMYYVTRHKLDGIYPDGWLSQSTTSTAVSDKLHLFGPLSRSFLLVVSMMVMLFESIKL